MNILLIGYGKMGRTIDQVARQRGHIIAGIVDKDNSTDLKKFTSSNTDVAIEFTHPEAAFQNITHCLLSGIPVVSGSTGWLERLPEVEQLCHEQQGALFYASNYSVGVNLFFHLNEYLASLLQRYPGYRVSLREIHHTQKVDKPSGTAISLAEGLLPHYPHLKGWALAEEGAGEAAGYLPIASERIENVVGTHVVRYDSAVDTLEISHVAHNRLGFAEGAVLAAEWLQGRQGVFGMKDMLNL